MAFHSKLESILRISPIRIVFGLNRIVMGLILGHMLLHVILIYELKMKKLMFLGYMKELSDIGMSRLLLISTIKQHIMMMVLVMVMIYHSMPLHGMVNFGKIMVSFVVILVGLVIMVNHLF
jgi:hypothetical protein